MTSQRAVDFGGILDIVFKKATSRKFYREYNIAQQLEELLKQNNGKTISLRIRGQIIVFFSDILIHQITSFVLNIRKVMTNLIDIEEFRTKRRRINKQGENKKALGTIKKDKKARNDDSNNGTPIQVMLRRNTPKADNIIDSDSSSTNRQLQGQRRPRGNKSQSGSEPQVNGFIYKFVPTQYDLDKDMEGDYQPIYQAQLPHFNSDQKDPFSGAKPKNPIQKIRTQIQNLLNLNDKSKQSSQAGSITRQQQRPKKKRNKRQKTVVKRVNKQALYKIDEQLQVKDKQSDDQQTVDYTRANILNPHLNSVSNYVGESLFDITHLDMNNIIKQFSVVQFGQSISAVKQFQKSYYQAQSLLRTPLNDYLHKDEQHYDSGAYDIGNDGQAEYSNDQNNDNSLNIADMSFNPQQRLHTIAEQTQLSSPIDASAQQLINIMINTKIGINEISEKKSLRKEQKARLFLSLLNPQYKLTQRQIPTFGEILVKSIN